MAGIMAKKAPAPKKQRWYQLIAQAYRSTASADKWLLPIMLLVFFGTIGAAVFVGVLLGSTAALVYAIIFGVMTAVLGTLFTLTRRFERNTYSQLEGSMGSSVAVAKSIRSGWAFEDDPVAIDPRGKAVVFQGVGKSGIVLLAEGGNAAHKPAETASRRINKLVPGVPVRVLYVGTGEGQVPVRKLMKTIRKGKTVLNRRERDAVGARLHAIGAQRPPVPKGIDPLKARPDRKGMRGR